jgi:hypothetical protein
MNDSKLISIDDDSLDQVAGGTFGLLGALLCAPVKLVGGLVSALLGGICAPAPSCPPPPPPSCRPRRGC